MRARVLSPLPRTGLLLTECDPPTFLRRPVGRWTVLPHVVVWALTPELRGVVAFGRPRPLDAQRALEFLDRVMRSSTDTSFTLILDGRWVEVDLDSLQVLMSFVRANRDTMRQHIREHVGLVGAGPAGFLLAGMGALVGYRHPYRVTADAAQAYGAGGQHPGLHREVERVVSLARDTSMDVLALQALLMEHSGALDVGSAAARLGVSLRTLQRQLTAAGVTFKDVQRQVRFQLAERLLVGTDLKVDAVARRLGISPAALNKVFRATTGSGPGRFRLKQRPQLDVLEMEDGPPGSGPRGGG